jgi:predicted AAA+ superfamily ATPase
MIKRILEKNLIQNLDNNKVIIVSGARQVGKTTLLKKIIHQAKEPITVIGGDNKDYHPAFEAQSFERLKEIVGRTKTILIDKAQNLPSIGFNLKLLHDHLPDLKIFVSGSSSFELK